MIPVRLNKKSLDRKAKVVTLLRFFGVQISPEQYRHIQKQQLEWFLYDAKASYLQMIKQAHPDPGSKPPSENAYIINQAWNALKFRMKKLGISL